MQDKGEKSKKRRRVHATLQLTKHIEAQPHLILLSMLSVLSSAKDLGGVFALAYATDLVVSGRPASRGIWIMLVVMLTGVIIAGWDAWIRARFELHARDQLMRRFTERFCSVELSARNLASMESKLNLFTEDIPSMIRWFRETLPAMIQLLAYLIGSILYSLFNHGRLTLIVIPLIVVLMPLLSKLTVKLTQTVTRERDFADRSMKQIEEVLADPEFIKAYGLEDVMRSRVDETLQARFEAECEGHDLRARAGGYSKIISFIPGILSALIGGYFFYRGQISAGFLIAFLQMTFGRFSYAVPKMSDYIQQTRTAEVYAQRINAYFDLSTEERQSDVSITSIPPGAPLFTLRDLSFAYPGGDPVLRGINLDLEAGEHIALVGSSGSGKSTLLKLMLGLYRGEEDYDGELQFRGRDLRQWQGDELRQYFAPVFQDSLLFNGTLLDNLRMVGSRTLQKSGHFTEEAQLLEALDLRTEELQQLIQDQGTGLSGGERQRVAIARALVKNAAVYFLDEPSSALDSVTEAKLDELLEETMKGRTAITVSHKLRTIEKADRIYYLQDGRITEVGTHAELMRMNGAYAQAYRLQAQEEAS